MRTRVLFALLILFAGNGRAWAADAALVADATVTAAFKARCLSCHSSAKREGDLDLEKPLAGGGASIAADAGLWERVLENIASGEMPPQEAPPLSAEQRAAIEGWVGKTLDGIATRTAGDPGPVSLRRLSHMEYTYTIRDLTGVESLDPVRDLRAQQQGSTNQAAAQGGMSEALLAKYLDAANEVASHAVLLPDGIRFSASDQRQDWIDEYLAKIRGFYARFTADGSGGKTVQHGVSLTLGDGGRLPVDRYLAALQAGAKAGSNRGPAGPTLNQKYLAILQEALESKTPSPILDPLRAKFRAGTLQAADVAAWQSGLWRFAQVGHIGKVGGPKAWQEPVDPIVTAHEIRLPLAAPKDGGDVTVFLVTHDAGDGAAGDVVVWEKPRITTRGRPDLPLHELSRTARRRAAFARSSQACLTAAHEHLATDPKPAVAELAAKHRVRQDMLEAWLGLLAPPQNAPAGTGAAPAAPAPKPAERIPNDSLLAAWKAATTDEARAQAAKNLAALLAKPAQGPISKPDGKLLAELLAIADGLPTEDSSDLGAADDYGPPPGLFGRGPDGSAVDAGNLVTAPGATVEFRVPESLLGPDGAFVATARLLDPAADGSAQTAAVTTRPAALAGLLPPGSKSQQAGGNRSDKQLRSDFNFPILVAPSGTKRKLYETACAEFRKVFPLALCYPKIVPVDEVVTLMLYYREDDQLCRLMLDDAQQAELDRLWDALALVSEAPLEEVVALEQIIQFATQDADPKVFEPLREPYREKAEAFRRARAAAEPRHVQAVVALAGQAWRRPLAAAEQDGLRKLYGTLRAEGLEHAAAVRMLLAGVLTSPEFLYRGERPAQGMAAVPVSDQELATRLSYFLWSSLPDDELRAAAAAGKLHEPDVLAAQARRMLADPKIRRLAAEFGCEYLHVGDVATLDEKSETHFPTFKAVRGDMQEEIVRFFTDLFQADRSVLTLLDADHTFVNGPLAQHYALPGIDPKQAEWKRIDGMQARGRGGMLGFAATQARQAGASRTSPILRGTWVWEVVLGQKLPKPPQGVPQLPEETPAGLTERELTQRHSSDARCAGCHQRIDPYGFALEGFDAIGRSRQKDAAGLPIDTATALADGTALAGLDGLRQHLLGPKRDDVVRQFCRKLLMYALGRPLLISDKPLVEDMVRTLAAHDYKVGMAIDRIVRSPQFREVRGMDYAGVAVTAPRP
jgi:hypothetical protein